MFSGVQVDDLACDGTNAVGSNDQIVLTLNVISECDGTRLLIYSLALEPRSASSSTASIYAHSMLADLPRG